MANKSVAAYSLDVDRLIREETTEWFTSNRKDLETVFRRVADRVREDVEAVWKEENLRLREQNRSLEEEIKRYRQILGVVRNQVVEEEQRQG
jgi:hypothetical protein